MPVKTFSVGELATSADVNTYLANAGLVHIATATAAGTNRALAVDNVFTTDYSHYRVVVSMRSTINTNGFFYQYIDTTGATVATGYYGTAYGQDFTTGATGFSVLSVTTVQYVGWIPNSSTATLTASFDIYNPRSSSLVTSVAGSHVSISSGFSYLGGHILGQTTGTTAFRGIRFDNGGAGNLTGTVSVYGYRIP